MAFRAFLDLPRPGPSESSYMLGICPSASQVSCLRTAITFPGFARAFSPPRLCLGHFSCAECPSLTPHLNPSLSGSLPGKAHAPTFPSLTSHQYWGHPHLTGALPGWRGAESSLGPQRASQSCLLSCPMVQVQALSSQGCPRLHAPPVPLIFPLDSFLLISKHWKLVFQLLNVVSSLERQ